MFLKALLKIGPHLSASSSFFLQHELSSFQHLSTSNRLRMIDTGMHAKLQATKVNYFLPFYFYTSFFYHYGLNIYSSIKTIFFSLLQLFQVLMETLSCYDLSGHTSFSLLPAFLFFLVLHCKLSSACGILSPLSASLKVACLPSRLTLFHQICLHAVRKVNYPQEILSCVLRPWTSMCHRSSCMVLT